ncbi:hypothetical protein PHET_08367 [Paragonimus heterotremus]|uniref:Uncharacterized protein n=1 Tax=Paragonimus heterotremus TaxID=100268 RepID=A0A8J4WG64_9TREM|nr:hypothetical protein PHET_08367 [Paragonimus heterotremus]
MIIGELNGFLNCSDNEPSGNPYASDEHSVRRRSQSASKSGLIEHVPRGTTGKGSWSKLKQTASRTALTNRARGTTGGDSISLSLTDLRSLRSSSSLSDYGPLAKLTVHDLQDRGPSDDLRRGTAITLRELERNHDKITNEEDRKQAIAWVDMELAAVRNIMEANLLCADESGRTKYSRNAYRMAAQRNQMTIERLEQQRRLLQSEKTAEAEVTSTDSFPTSSSADGTSRFGPDSSEIGSDQQSIHSGISGTCDSAQSSNKIDPTVPPNERHTQHSWKKTKHFPLYGSCKQRTSCGGVFDGLTCFETGKQPSLESNLDTEHDTPSPSSPILDYPEQSVNKSDNGDCLNSIESAQSVEIQTTGKHVRGSQHIVEGTAGRSFEEAFKPELSNSSTPTKNSKALERTPYPRITHTESNFCAPSQASHHFEYSPTTGMGQSIIYSTPRAMQLNNSGSDLCEPPPAPLLTRRHIPSRVTVKDSGALAITPNQASDGRVIRVSCQQSSSRSVSSPRSTPPYIIHTGNQPIGDNRADVLLSRLPAYRIEQPHYRIISQLQDGSTSQQYLTSYAGIPDRKRPNNHVYPRVVEALSREPNQNLQRSEINANASLPIPRVTIHKVPVYNLPRTHVSTCPMKPLPMFDRTIYAGKKGSLTPDPTLMANHGNQLMEAKSPITPCRPIVTNPNPQPPYEIAIPTNYADYENVGPSRLLNQDQTFPKSNPNPLFSSPHWYVPRELESNDYSASPSINSTSRIS